MVVTWVLSSDGLKMATDVALPIPDAAVHGNQF